jgi:hypothetical protein
MKGETPHVQSLWTLTKNRRAFGPERVGSRACDVQLSESTKTSSVFGTDPLADYDLLKKQ